MRREGKGKGDDTLHGAVLRFVWWISLMSSILFFASFAVHFPQEYAAAREKVDGMRRSFEFGPYVGTCADPVRVAREGLQEECARRASASRAIPEFIAVYNSLRKSISGSAEIMSLVGLGSISAGSVGLFHIVAFASGFVASLYLTVVLMRMARGAGSGAGYDERGGASRLQDAELGSIAARGKDLLRYPIPYGGGDRMLTYGDRDEDSVITMADLRYAHEFSRKHR